jgi:hypothetical protein
LEISHSICLDYSLCLCLECGEETGRRIHIDAHGGPCPCPLGPQVDAHVSAPVPNIYIYIYIYINIHIYVYTYIYLYDPQVDGHDSAPVPNNRNNLTMISYHSDNSVYIQIYKHLYTY